MLKNYENNIVISSYELAAKSMYYVKIHVLFTLALVRLLDWNTFIMRCGSWVQQLISVVSWWVYYHYVKACITSVVSGGCISWTWALPLPVFHNEDLWSSQYVAKSQIPGDRYILALANGEL